jgi:hypothetical protein
VPVESQSECPQPQRSQDSPALGYTKSVFNESLSVPCSKGSHTSSVSKCKAAVTVRVQARNPARDKVWFTASWDVDDCDGVGATACLSEYTKSRNNVSGAKQMPVHSPLPGVEEFCDLPILEHHNMWCRIRPR